MRMTAHRNLVLAALQDAGGDCGDPPHSAADVLYTLDMAHRCNYRGYGHVKTKPTKQQLHRTLKELWHAGVIVASRDKYDRPNTLPGWVIRYELAEGMFERALEHRIDRLAYKVNRALHGIVFGMFGAKPFDRGVTPGVAAELQAELDALLARSDDPRLHECRAAIEAGLPLPDNYLPKDAKGLKAIMQANHPDRGGSRVLFEQAAAALAELRKAA